MVPACVRSTEVLSESCTRATPKSVSLVRALRVDHHVRRLDVAVDDAGVVRELERVAQLAHDAHRFLQVEALVRVEEVLEFLALDELHDEVGDVAFLAEVVHLDDVRMVEPRDRLGLAHEAHRIVLGRILVEVALEDGLDRDAAAEPRVDALVDDAHRALAERALDVVAAERLEFRNAASRSWLRTLLHPLVVVA